jgi:hypothetical protein
MNKGESMRTIYEEAQIKLNHGFEFGLSYKHLNDILGVLERAKRVEKLLNLYRDLSMETDIKERLTYWGDITVLEIEIYGG